MFEIYRKTQHRATREYTCHLCGGTIRKGAEYIYQVSKHDGVLNDYRRHIHCDALLNAWVDMTGENEYTSEKIKEFLYSAVCNHCPMGENGMCDKAECFACDIVLGVLLRPTILSAAKKSAEE